MLKHVSGAIVRTSERVGRMIFSRIAFSFSALVIVGTKSSRQTISGIVNLIVGLFILFSLSYGEAVRETLFEKSGFPMTLPKNF